MSSSIIQVKASKKIQSRFRANRTKKLAATKKIQSSFRGTRSRRAVKLLKETIKATTNKCPICFEPMKKNITIALPCGHIFHTKCIKQALRYNNKCPNCRRVITNVSLETRRRRKRTFRNVVFRPLQMLRNLYNARTRRNRQTQNNNVDSVINALQESIAAREAEKVIEQRIATILARTTRATERTATQRRRISIRDLQIEELNLRAARERYRLANERAQAMYNALPESQRIH
jgi:hypothetical protein